MHATAVIISNNKLSLDFDKNRLSQLINGISPSFSTNRIASAHESTNHGLGDCASYRINDAETSCTGVFCLRQWQGKDNWATQDIRATQVYPINSVTSIEMASRLVNAMNKLNE